MRKTMTAGSDILLSRRTLLGGAALLAAPALITRPAQAAESCVVGTWGGDYARLLRDNIDTPLLKPQGIDVVQDVADETARVARSCSPRAGCRTQRGCRLRGIAEGFRCKRGRAGRDAGRGERAEPEIPAAGSEIRTFVPHIYSAQVLVYNPQTVTEPPKTFGDC